MSLNDPDRPEAAEAMTRCGAAGWGLAEIAGALGWTRAELAQRAAHWPYLGEAIARARDAALAWWEARARLWAGLRSNAALWGRAMAGRFAAEGYATGRAAAAKPEAPKKPPRAIDDRERVKALCRLLAEQYAPPWSQRILDVLAQAEAETPIGMPWPG